MIVALKWEHDSETNYAILRRLAEELKDQLKAIPGTEKIDIFGDPKEEVVAGWRNPNASGKVGIRLYEATPDGWKMHTLDDNTMACEDAKAADLNGDGKLDLVAAGRATKNVVIYWNEN